MNDERDRAGARPWEQSGFSGTEPRWLALRKPVADCIDRAGTFLDIGCANGYLAECVAAWTAERGLAVDVYGIDLSPPRVALAQRRLPALASHFAVADARAYRPERRLDFVRTELVYVPAEDEAAYVAHLLGAYLAPGGRLLIANYLEDSDDAASRIPAGAHPTTNLLSRLEALGFVASSWCDGLDPVKRRKTRVAVLHAPAT
jgi:SAM-dependent methyltransferase